MIKCSLLFVFKGIRRGGVHFKYWSDMQALWEFRTQKCNLRYSLGGNFSKMLCNTVKRLVVYNLYNLEKLGFVSRDLKDRETESLQESKPNFPPRTLRTQPKNLLLLPLLLTMSSTRNLALNFLFDHNFMTKILNFWNSVTQHQFPSPPTSIFYHSHHLCA